MAINLIIVQEIGIGQFVMCPAFGGHFSLRLCQLCTAHKGLRSSLEIPGSRSASSPGSEVSFVRCDASLAATAAPALPGQTGLFEKAGPA